MSGIPHLYSSSSLEEVVALVEAVEAAGIDMSGVRSAYITIEEPSSLYRSHASSRCSRLPNPGSQSSRGSRIQIGKVLERPRGYCSTCVASAIMKEVGRPLHELGTLARTHVSTKALNESCSVRALAEAAQNLAHQLTWSSLGDADSREIQQNAVESTARAYLALAPSLERLSTYRNLYASYRSAPAPAVDLSDLMASPVKVLDDTFKAFCTAGYDGSDAKAAAIRKAEMMSRFGVSRDMVALRLDPVIKLWERLHEGLLPAPDAPRTVLYRESWAGLPFHDVPRAIASTGMVYEERSFFHVSSAEASLLLTEDHYAMVLGQVEAHRAAVVCSLAQTLHIEGLALDDAFASYKTAFEGALLASSEPASVLEAVSV